MVKKPTPATPGPPQFAGMANVILGQTIKASVAKAVGKVAGDAKVPGLKQSDSHDVAGAMIDSLSRDPTFINATNSEAPYQSRVGIGSATGVVGALGLLVPIILGLVGIEIEGGRIVEIGLAVMTLWGAGYSLYGRFMPRLKPLFSRATPSPPPTS